jgi:uncharacterized protein (DUF58 family)
MRSSLASAFGSLTTRGRAFVSSGVTAIVCALVLGLDDLARVGFLLLALPLLAAGTVTRGRHRLGLARIVTPTRVTVGQTANVELALSNEGRTPTGLLLLEEQVPYTLGVRPRFVIDRMGSQWRRSVSYVVRSDVRGKFTLGPMAVRVADSFGLVELDRTFSSTTDLVITPRIITLPPVPLVGVWTGSGDNRPRDFAGGSAEDVTVREYRRGDDLRRVHWRSSARMGELMVRREEQPWQSRATLFIDNRRHAHRGSGPASSLEYAVTAGASVAMHLTQRGFRVRLVTADGNEDGRVWHEHGALDAEAGTLLESLAVMTDSPRIDIDGSWLSMSNATGLLVAVLGEVGAADRAMLSRMRHAASSPLAIALDVDNWARGGEGSALGPAPTRAVRLLGTHGWRAVAAGPRDPLPTVWKQLALTGVRSTGPSVGTSMGRG